jgi:TRAP-type uncharacterized transport system fused permease subunit
MFIYQPNLLLMSTEKHPLTALSLTMAILIACLGIVALAAGIVGYLDVIWKKSPLTWLARITLFIAAAMLLSPDVQVNGTNYGIVVNIAGSLILLGIVISVLALPPLTHHIRHSEEDPSDSADPLPDASN